MTVALDINSYAYLVRNGFFDRVKSLPQFAGVARFSRSKAKVIQNEQIPYLGCYLLDEQITPDGDANHGSPHFMHAAKLGFSYMVVNNDPEPAEEALDQGHWAIMNIIRRQDWHRFDNILVPDDYGKPTPLEIEAITRGSRSHAWGNAGLNNETPIAEMRMDLTFTFRSIWPPIVTDDLKKIHVTVRYPDLSTDRIPVEVEYDLPVE